MINEKSRIKLLLIKHNPKCSRERTIGRERSTHQEKTQNIIFHDLNRGYPRVMKLCIAVFLNFFSSKNFLISQLSTAKLFYHQKK
jgi:hypothetical protein